MRICLFTSTALPRLGGQELVVDHLARQFQALGHEPVVLAPYPRQRIPLDDAALPYPVVRHWRCRSRRYFVGLYARALKRLYRRRPFDVLHCHGLYPTAYLAALARPACPVPAVVTSHGDDVAEGGALDRKPWVRGRLALALQAADALVSLGDFTSRGLLRLCPTPRLLETIPNGIDLPDETRPPRRPADLDPAIRPGGYVLSLGRLNRRKGFDVLLRAWRRLPDTVDAHLVVVGDGAEMAVLRAQCDQLGLGGRVHFVGSRTGSDKDWLLRNARLGVVPSRGWEAFPLVVLEMQAAALPIVASDLPGLRERVHPDRTGVLVPAEDPAALARALADLWEAPGACVEMGETAREEARAFAWPVIARRHLDLYGRLRHGITPGRHAIPTTEPTVAPAEPVCSAP